MNEPWAHPDSWRFRAGAEITRVSQGEIDRLLAREQTRVASAVPWQQRLRAWLQALFAKRQAE